MKKIISILIAIMMVASLACTAAMAEEDVLPQPEGGKKFESNWALRGMITEITYEEEGYRVYIETYNPQDLNRNVWQYNCTYSEEKDALVSISSEKHTETFDPETFDVTGIQKEYEDLDTDDQATVFTINEEGKLIWKDGRGTDGIDLEFEDIGRFNGQYRNDAEQVCAEFEWEGLDEENFYYTVCIHRGEGAYYVEYNMQGLYNPETGKLECTGKATTWTLNANGGYDPTEDPETYDAFFSRLDNGNLLFETANGIELEYQDVPVDSING